MNPNFGSTTRLQLERASSTLRDATLAMLFPVECRVCGEMIESWFDGVACSQCWFTVEQKIERIRSENNFCAKCGLPLPHLPQINLSEARHCGRCDDLAFSVARACGVYEGALRESVLRLKSRPQISARLCKLLRTTAGILQDIQPCESIIPVPLHQSRFTERSFNQAEVIANKLAAITGLQVDTASLVRAKHTEKHRAGMKTRERARSLEKAFRVRALRLIENKAVLLVDDVMTTGSTANEIANTLLNGGAKTVSILTLARAATEFNF